MKVLDSYLKTPPFRNIPSQQAAQMLGFFTDRSARQGYPWKAHSLDEQGQPSARPISSLEALKRLQKNQAVQLVPYISRQMEVTTDTLDSLSPAGALGSGNDMPDLHETVLHPGFLGLEATYGKPVQLNSIAELKLLHDLYAAGPEIPVNDRTTDAIDSLSTFTRQRDTTAWRFYNQEARPSALGQTWETLKGVGGGLLLGAALGGVIGGPLGLWTESWATFLGLTAAGAAWFGQQRGREAWQESQKGQPLNALETLDRVLNDQPTVIQKTQLRSVGLPVLGKFTWHTDYGPGASVANSEELHLLSDIHSQSQPEQRGNQS